MAVCTVATLPPGACIVSASCANGCLQPRQAAAWFDSTIERKLALSSMSLDHKTSKTRPGSCPSHNGIGLSAQTDTRTPFKNRRLITHTNAIFKEASPELGEVAQFPGMLTYN